MVVQPRRAQIEGSMPYVPTHQKQLGRGAPVPRRTQGSRDCGPRSWQMAADARTQGRISPGVRRLRRRGHCQGPQATSIQDGRRALHDLAVPGRTRLKAYGQRRIWRVKQAVRTGRPVVLAIDYGDWNDSQKRATGDPNFRGAHAVLIFGQRQRGAGIEWLLCDPLDDGRRKGIERGPRWVLRKHLVRAAVKLADGRRDGIWALVVGGSYAHR